MSKVIAVCVLLCTLVCAKYEDGVGGTVAGTMGADVLAAAGANPTFAQLYAAFNQVFTDAKFTWDPSGTGGTSDTKEKKALDGTVNHGECAVLAGALHKLWSMDAPFGLGKAGSSVVTYEPEKNNAEPMFVGFISPHPVGGIHGLAPNIFSKTGVAQGLYSWENHKVVLHNGVYYDPSYRTTYAALTDMVAFTINTASTWNSGKPLVQENAAGTVHDTIFQATATAKATLVDNAWTNNRVMYFSQHVEKAARGGNPTLMQTRGPYTSEDMLEITKLKDKFGKFAAMRHRLAHIIRDAAELEEMIN